MENYIESYQNSGVRESDFQRLCQTIGTNIQKILQNVSSMQRIIAQIGTPQDNQQLQNQLHQIQHYTGQLAKDTSKHLQDLNSMSLASGGTSEQRPWRLQKERLQNDFTKALNNFQDAQRTAAQKEKEVINRAKSFAMPSLAKSGAQNLIDVESNDVGGELQGQSKTQLFLEEEYSIQQLQERERAMRQLESDIVDVNAIFTELATMVHKQGEMVDSIEENVSSTHIRVQEGTEQLRQAERYKVKARKKKLILIVIGLIVLAIIIGLIVWAAKN